MNTTTVSVRGIRTTLEIGAMYDVRTSARERVRTLRGVSLDERAANGELIFILRQHPEPPERIRVRPRDIDGIVPLETPDPYVDLEAALAARSVISPRGEDETARGYLARLERGLGTGAYGRWVETEPGQAALAAAAAEDQDARRRAKPTRPPRTDARCWPHPCRDYHGTYAHESGEDPCDCPCHRPRSPIESPAGRVTDARGRSYDDPDAYAEATGVPVAVEITPRGRRQIAEQLEPAGSGGSADESPRPRSARGPRGGMRAVDVVERQIEREAPIVGRSRGTDLSPEEEARRARNRAREMARNVQWTCGTCHRRTRQPVCTNGHPAVAAPVGKRRDARTEGCESGWTGDRCTLPLGHAGDHSNERNPR